VPDRPSVVNRVVAGVGKLASLPEKKIRKLFESVDDDELEAYQGLVDEAVVKADRVVNVDEDESQKT